MSEASENKVSVKKVKLGKLDAFEIENLACGSSIKITQFGATICSFITSDGKERLFLSKEAILDGSKAIRGGIPVVWPQFGPGKLPQHGFARNCYWKMQSASAEEMFEGETVVIVTMSLNHKDDLNLTEDIRKVFSKNLQFNLDLVTIFGANWIEARLIIGNEAEKDFPIEFQALLHTYFLVENSTKISILGLNGKNYYDKVKGVHLKQEDSDLAIKIDQEVDRVYEIKESDLDEEANSTVHVIDTESKAKLFSVKFGLTWGGISCLPDVVVWNPWEEKSKKMADFGDEEYQSMLCIEPGCVSRYEVCEPNEAWSLSQTITFHS